MPIVNLILAAGKGQRFKDAGYKEDKPFIDLKGRPMISRVNQNLRSPYLTPYTFVLCRQEHLEAMRPLLSSDLLIPIVRGEIGKGHPNGDGAAYSALCAINSIEKNLGLEDFQLMISNSDQIVGPPGIITDALSYWQEIDADAGLLVFPENHPKWSYAKHIDGQVTEIVEKQPISPWATCGIHYFKSSAALKKALIAMMDEGFKVNGEFYFAPSINWMIKQGGKVYIYDVPIMLGLGTPEDFKESEKSICECLCSPMSDEEDQPWFF